MKTFGRAVLWPALVLVLLGAAAPAAAQTITTGTLSGLVEDQQGGALPGATVTATHTTMGTAYQVVTGADGRYLILNVRVGVYTVKVTMPGFKDAEVKDVTVSLGEERATNFSLQVSVSETVTVTAENPPIDLSRAGIGGNVSNELKEALPTVARSITDLVRTNVYYNPMGLNDDAPAASVAGRSQRYNSFQIDGAVNNDLFGLGAGGGTPGGNAGTQPISLDAIQEIQLVVSPYDIRQSGFSGGGINAITKTGTNNIHGTGYFFGRNQNLVSDGFTKKPISEFSDYQSGASLGGPIVANKAFYFANYDNQRRRNPSGFSVGGSGQSFAPGNEALFNQFVSDLKNLYGYDLGSSAGSEFIRSIQSDKVFVRGDFNLGRSQLTLRHNYVGAFQDVIGTLSATAFITPDSFYRFNSKTNSTVGQLTTRFGASVNELRIAGTFVREHRSEVPPYDTNFPTVTVTLFGSTTVRAGREANSGRNALDQDIIEVTDDFTKVVGQHQFTVGTHNEFFHFRNLFITNYYGVYTFNNLQLFEQGLAQSYSHGFSTQPGTDFAADFGVQHMGFYGGDQWRPAARLTVTYGARFDFVHYPDKPNYNPAADQFGYRTDVVPNNTLFSPRAGLNYALKSDGSEQLRGGIGMFAGRTPYVWISNQFGNTGLDVTRLTVNNATGNRIPFIANPDAQYTSPSQITGVTATIPTNEIDLINPDFKYPSIVRGNIGYDRKLPMGWYGTAEYMFTSTVNDIRYENLNLKQIATSNIDGRPFYATQNTALSNVLLLTNTDEGSSWTVSFEGKRPFKNGVFLDVAYLYGRARTIMDGTRDQALSTWGNAYTTGDPNHPTLGISDYDPGHRVNVTGTYTHGLGKGVSGTASVFYSVQSGRPYTVLFGNPGVNGDGQSFNDIMFLMNTAPAGVTFQNGTFQDLLNYFNSYDCMAKQLGSAMERNSCRSPWTNTLDARFAVTLPVKKVKAEITFDVMNILNMLSSDWGVFRYANFNDVTPVSQTVSNATGQVTAINVASLTNAAGFSNFVVGDLRSRAQAQIGARIRW